MPLTPEQEIAFKKQRRDQMFQTAGKFIGVLSALAILIALGMAIYHKIQDKPKLEWDYVKEVYGPDGKGVRLEKSEPQTDIVSHEGKRASELLESVNFQLTGETAPTISPMTPVSAPVKPLAATPHSLRSLETRKQEIELVVKEFFQAKSVTQLLPLVRDARRVRPLIEDFYTRHPLQWSEWKGIGWVMPVEEPGYRFAYVQATFENAPPVHVVVEETDTGFYVDWESAVHYSELGWKEFLSSRPDKPKTFRVLASRLETASEGANGTVLQLKHPAEDGVILGRFDANDPRFRPLLDQLELCQWKDVPVILQLCYPGPAVTGTEVIQIAGVEGRGWLILSRTRG